MVINISKYRLITFSERMCYTLLRVHQAYSTGDRFQSLGCSHAAKMFLLEISSLSLEISISA